MAELVDARVLGTRVLAAWRFKSSSVHFWLKYLVMAENQLITEKDLSSLFEMINRLKMRELFEEPSSFEDEPED